MVTWYIDKSLDKANSSAAEDGGLAIPPMDVGALFISQATTIQHVSEVLNYIKKFHCSFSKWCKHMYPIFVKERGAYT
jgi:hypothetical protein